MHPWPLETFSGSNEDEDAATNKNTTSQKTYLYFPAFSSVPSLFVIIYNCYFICQEIFSMNLWTFSSACPEGESETYPIPGKQQGRSDYER
jgi:hypothetical protein